MDPNAGNLSLELIAAEAFPYISSDFFDEPNAGSDAGFENNLEQADITGTRHMRATTKPSGRSPTNERSPFSAM